MKKLFLLMLFNAAITGINAQHAKTQHCATFENLTLSPNSYWNGSSGTGGFQNSNFFFPNSYTDYGGGSYAWSGFAYSNQTDTITPGIDNQFSAIAGSGVNASANYAVTYVNSDWMTGAAVPNTIIFDSTFKISGCYITNNTYAYLSMKNGDLFSKKFGGTSGNDPDWFKITAWGYYQGNATDSIEFYLADYRFTNNQQDYIIKQWTWWNMDTLGNIDSLKFILSSSDTNAYGMKTPAYFCIDNFTASTPTVAITQNNSSILHIFPNPTTDYLFLNNLNNQYETLQIVDITGKIILQLNVAQTNDLQLNVSMLPKGLYFLRLSNNNTFHNLKFQKK